MVVHVDSTWTSGSEVTNMTPHGRCRLALTSALDQAPSICHVAVSSWMSACKSNLMPFGLPTGALPCVLTCSRCEYGFTSTHTVLSLYRCSYKETHAMGQVPPVRGTSHLQGLVILSLWPAQTMI